MTRAGARGIGLLLVFGLVGPFAWTWLSSQMVVYWYIPLLDAIQVDAMQIVSASAQGVWSGTQAVVGSLCAFVLSGLLALLLRAGRRLHDGACYLVLFFSVCVTPMVSAPARLFLFLQLPDTWAFLLTSIGLLALLQRRARSSEREPRDHCNGADAAHRR